MKKTLQKGKRIICALCVSSILLSAFSIKGNAQTPTIDEIENRFEVFRVINYETPTFQDDGTVTRGKMAEIIGRLQGFSTPNMYPPIENCFADVDISHPEYIWILMAKNAYYISGDENGYYYPDDKVTEIDAAKMLLSLAGYDWLAKDCGGYPQGYANAAKILMLTKETGDLTAEPITRPVLLQILNRYIDLYAVGMGENNTIYVSEGDERSGGDGTMKDYLKLNAYGIQDPFETDR